MTTCFNGHENGDEARRCKVCNAPLPGVRQHAETFVNEMGNEIHVVAWTTFNDPLKVRYILEGPNSHTYQTMTPMETERLILHLKAALGSQP